MFGKKAKKITALTEKVKELFTQRFNLECALAGTKNQVTHLTVQLQEETQKLNEENRDLQIRLELLQSVLKQLDITVKFKK